MEAKRRLRKMEKQQHPFLHLAELILPYLPPADLASASSTCTTIRDIVRCITVRRSSDAGRGFERNPIPFINQVDRKPYYYFTYTPIQTLSVSSSDSRPQPWGYDYDPDTRPNLIDPFIFRVDGAQGCPCLEKCERVLGCPCFGDEGAAGLECGPSCGCGPDCGNRVTQGGVLVKLKIFKDSKKYWCLYAAEFIPCGKFVCEYAGELLTTKEAQSRQKIYDNCEISDQLSPALLVVKEHLPSRDVCMRTNIDATRVANVARFINHSCDGGNLNTVIVRASGSLMPRICLFTSRDIHNDEELNFSYGDIRVKKQGLPCFCGSSCCQGILPSENT